MPNPESKESFEIVSRVSKTFIKDFDIWQRQYTEMEDGYRYLAGDQYKPKQRQWYNTQRRPTREFNIIFPTFNTVLGDFVLQDDDMNVFPKAGGSPKTADDLEDLLDHANDQNDHRSVMLKTALSGFIKCGWVYPRYSNEREIDGSIIFDNVDEFEVMFDPRSRHNLLDDALYVIRSRFLTMEDLEFYFPKYKKLFRESLQSIKDHGEWGYMDEFMKSNINNVNFINEFQGKYRLLEFHEMDWELSEVALDLTTGRSEIFSLEGKKADLYRRLHPEVRIVTRKHKVKRIHNVLPALSILIDSKKADIQDGTYDYIPFCAYNFGKNSIDNFGIFRNARKPQDDFNEWTNLSAHAVAKAVDPGYTKKPSMIENNNTVDNYSNETGLIIDVKANAPSINDAIRRNEPPSLPFAPNQMSRESVDLLGKITGITPNFAGASETKQENASLFANRVKQAAKSLLPVYANFSAMKRRLYNKNIRLMQENYTNERYFLIKGREGEQRELAINQQIGDEIVNDIRIGRYEVIVTDVENNPTEKFVRFIQKTEVVQAVMQMFGGAIGSPGAIVAILNWWLKESDLGDIDKFIQTFAQSVQDQQEAEAEQAESDEALQASSAILDLAQKKINLDNSSEQQDNSGTSQRASA